MTVIFFADIYRKASALLHGEDPILIQGVLDAAEDSFKIIATEAQLLNEATINLVSSVQFYVDEAVSDDISLKIISELLRKYPGKHDASLRILSKNFDIIISLGEHNKIQMSAGLKKEADGLLGTGSTHFI